MFLKIKLFFKNLLYKWLGPTQADDELLIAMLSSEDRPVPLDQKDLQLLDSIVKEFVRTNSVDWNSVEIDKHTNPKLYRVISLFKEELIDTTDYFAAVDLIYTRYPELVDVGIDL
tara:strand:- start:7903 stop:8247 length:345 start_codon:yes stop_codon:yes gene_type:complete